MQASRAPRRRDSLPRASPRLLGSSGRQGPRSEGGASPAGSAGRWAVHVRAGGVPRRRGRGTRKRSRTCGPEPGWREAARTAWGGGLTARAAAGCGHRWAAAARAQRSGAGVPGTPAVTLGVLQSRDRGTRPRRWRSRPFFLRLGFLGCSRTSARSAGNFPSKVILLAGRCSRPARVLTIGGGGRGKPCAGWRSGAGRRPGALPRAAGGFPRAGSSAPAAGGRRLQRIHAVSLLAARRVSFHPRPGSGGDRSARTSRGAQPPASRLSRAAWSAVAMGTAGVPEPALDRMGR